MECMTRTSLDCETPPEVECAWDEGGSYPTIYRVPPEILSYKQSAYEDAYRPKAVCIGPYFYCCRNDNDLKSMEDYKWKCVQKLACEYNICITNFRAKCLMKMKELDRQVRNCYSEDISWLNCEELACMLMLDGCFILHLLLHHGRKKDRRDKVDEKFIGKSWIWSLVKYDLLLLENQIPFFVIQKLYEILLETRDCRRINLVERALEYFSSLDICRKGRSLRSFCTPPTDDVHHLLHLIYQSILPCPLTTFRQWSPRTTIEFDCKQDPPLWIPSATELKKAGVKFEKRKMYEGSFLEIKYGNRVMEIPHLELHDHSDSLFRNLIAFEQCYPLSDFHVTAYAAFMDCLIDTHKDWRLLQMNQILTFTMADDDDRFHFFGRLRSGVHYSGDGNYLGDNIRLVLAYMDTDCAKLLATYFPHPWSKIVAFVGFLASVATMIQTVYTVHPPHS